MKKTLLTLAFLLCAHAALAQHPCEVTPPTSFQLTPGEQVKIGACAGVDVNGQPTPIAGWEISTNGSAFLSIPMTPVGAPSTVNGRTYYESAQFPANTAGTFVLRVVNANGISLPSTPITVVLSATVLPAAPTGIRLTRP